LFLLTTSFPLLVIFQIALLNMVVTPLLERYFIRLID
jgi:hypothetical protein